MTSFFKVLFCTSFLTGFAAVLSAKPQVLTSNTILWDLSREVAGDLADVTSLAPVGMDPHAYEPSPADLVRLQKADLIVVNGLELEPWAERVIASLQHRASVVTASDGARLLTTEGTQTVDPHAWQDPDNVARYLENIGEGLAAVDPAQAVAYRSRAAALAEKFRALKTEFFPSFAALPTEQRKIVTSHDALGYLGRAFGLEIVPLSGLNPDQEPNARELARIIDWIRAQHVRAVFIESTSSPKIPTLIAAEAGIAVVTELHTDSLGLPGTPAATTYGMLRSNIAFILQGIDPK